MKIKICGLSTKEAVDAAVKAGATHLGFILSKSRRQVSPERIAEMTRDVPATVQKVGVFVDESLDFVKKAYAVAGLNLVQLHGSEDMNYIRDLDGLPVMKAVSSVEQAAQYEDVILLLDSPQGGSGQTFDWKSVKSSDLNLPFFVAGGLTPGNVADAVQAFPTAYGVDVSSGVETEGAKDTEKIRDFIFNASLTRLDDLEYIDALSKKFDDFDKTLGITIESERFQLKLAPNGVFQAGLAGRKIGNELRINYLFVDATFRRQGLGSFLLDKAESYARANEIRYIRLSTLSVYAPDFYKQRGYELYHIFKNAPIDGINRMEFAKKL